MGIHDRRFTRFDILENEILVLYIVRIGVVGMMYIHDHVDILHFCNLDCLESDSNDIFLTWGDRKSVV